ncbi:MAG: DUF5134 domain-containing protein [Mycobacteriaceae bacterium]|nr:DUF5134 domain-containing protein [Mycobacteriaceae bacterium]
MITEIVLRWVVTAMFAVSAAHCVAALRQPGGLDRVGHCLHLLMCLAMIAMAWPFSMSWPTIPPMVLFVVAAAWFAVAAVTRGGRRPTHAYHAVMMAAMAFMYAAMTEDLIPGSGSVMAGMDAGGGMAGMDMPGMDMGGTQMSSAPAAAAGVDWTRVGATAWVAVFAAAAVLWLYRYFAHRAAAPGAGHHDHAAHLRVCEATMAAGMAVMFAAML